MNKRIRRICLYSGPGAGKSVIAGGLYYLLGKAGVNVELVREFIKEEMVYNNRFPEGFDQSWIFGSQMHREEKALRNNAYIIADSPLLLSAVYTIKYKSPGSDEMINQARMFEEKYPSLNIFLDRDGVEYRKDGRYQSYAEALEIDELVKRVLDETNTSYVIIKTIDMERILSHVECNLRGDENVEAA